MAKKEKYQFLDVIIKRTYIIPIYDKERTKINGWPLSTVIEDWFERVPLDSFHATRDNHYIGGSSKVIETKPTKIIETKDT